VVFGLAWLVLQAASGAWVSTNYAVLACTDFPQCQGTFWPAMDFAAGFELWRPLGQGGDGQFINFQALTAIHFMHRGLAMLTLLLLGALCLALWRKPALQTPTRAMAALLTLQILTGVSNVVLDWPLLGAVLHTGGAGAMGAVLVWLLTTTRSQRGAP
jgi:cytochrome c oxidase assembly protein subunit 15